jgi:hypothetical protein
MICCQDQQYINIFTITYFALKVLYWDHTPHRVSRAAAAFLDEIWKKPLLQLNVINPLVSEVS